MGVEAQMKWSNILFNHILEPSSDKDSLPFHQIIVFIVENKGGGLCRDVAAPTANVTYCPQSSPRAPWGRGSSSLRTGML